ncbi:hypothetical protein GmHk_10G030316 [Glycine max]|nr:hypothetical protein GmHk_10G030316 [Glycine max]
MAFRSASLSRSLMSTARASLRQAAPSSPLPRLRPPPLAAPRVQSRRFSMPASSFLVDVVLNFYLFLSAKEFGAIGVHTIAFAADYNLHDVTRCCQCACLLRTVPWYLPSFLSRSLIVSLDEWKRWVMRKDIDHPMAREECCIVREETVGFA